MPEYKVSFKHRALPVLSLVVHWDALTANCIINQGKLQGAVVLWSGLCKPAASAHQAALAPCELTILLLLDASAKISCKQIGKSVDWWTRDPWGLKALILLISIAAKLFNCWDGRPNIPWGKSWSSPVVRLAVFLGIDGAHGNYR